jgi:hypothetical protein
MAVTYAFTIRPASTFHCPEGAGRSIDDTAGRCGHVTYDEPLSEPVAAHWSLDPIGPKLPRLGFDGDTWSFRALLGSLAPRLEYGFACGLITRGDVDREVAAMAADYGEEIAVLWEEA